jgi:hypothetical protein
MSSVYLSLKSDNSLHTLILKKKVENYVFLVSIGYGGGRTFGEFFSKLRYDNQNGIIGLFSYSCGSEEWEKKILSVKYDKMKEKLNVQKEDLFELMDIIDKRVQNEMLKEIKNIVYWGYDVETNEEYDDPILKNIEFSKFKNLSNSDHYVNEEWNDEFLEITNTDVWLQSIRFPKTPNHKL